MGLADFFLYGGSSGGGGGGSSLPSNWDVENNSLTIKGEGLNSLGWRCSNKDYYFEKIFSWTVVDEEDDQNFRTYDKINDIPGLIILFRFGGSAKSYCLGISTSAGGAQIKDRNNDNAVRGSFEYLDHTWYYCRTNPGTDFGICDDLELITLSGVNDGDVEAAKLAIDYAGISFEASNDFTQLASPDKDYTIAAGGSASDFSDATFRVNSSGDVFGGNFYSNGVAISSAFTGATSSSAGAQGIVPAPSSADVNKFLKGNGSWAEAGTPGNWNINPTSLVMQDTGKEVNSLGWYCGNKENYYEDTITWSITEPGSQTHIFTKVNAKPAFIACVHLLNGYWMDAIAVSTVADATYFSNNSQAHEFTYMDHTWYWSGGEQSLPFTASIQVSGVNTLPNDTISSLEDAAKFLIDQGLVSFNSGKKTILSDPSQEHIILSGGIQDDGSDATFKVSNAGVIEANGMVVNGVAVTSAFTGATSSAAGSVGLVPAPGISDREKILKGDGTWMTQKPSPISYSTSEQDTRIKWIDGNKIYQITKVYENVAQTSDSSPLTLDTLSDVDTLVKYDVRAITTGGGIINDNFYLDSSYKFHTIYYPNTKELQYRANWGGSGYFTITITYQYTKFPSLDDAVITTSNFDAGNVSASQRDYVYKNWRVPSNVFSPGYRDFNITADLDSSAVYMWSTYETAERIDGCDWLRYDHSESFVPYCVGIWAHSSNAWGGSYPTVYLEFSNDGTTWDTLYTGIPTIPAGTCCYIPVDTSNSYTKFRIRYNNGTGALGSEWNGALPNITIYGE